MGQAPQMFSQYWSIARSEENMPLHAVLRIDMRDQVSPLSHARETSS